MKTIKSFFLILICKIWAQSKFSLGFLYQFIDKQAGSFTDQVLLKKITNKTSMFCRLKEHVDRRIYFFGAYEPIESFLSQKLLSPDSIIIDAGANIGFHSLIWSEKLSNGKVYAFEPVPMNHEKLLKNIKASGQRENIQVVQKGLWKENTTLTFNLDSTFEDNKGSFSIGHFGNIVVSTSCQVITIDSFVNDHKLSRIDFIKMDIEGAELPALQGAESVLLKYKPSLFLEINAKAMRALGYSPSDLQSFLWPFNYKMYLIQSTFSSSRFIESIDNIEQANVLFLNSAHAEKLKFVWNEKTIINSFIDGHGTLSL